MEKFPPDKASVVDVGTDVCALDTAAAAFLGGCRVEVPEECVASFTEENHQFGLQHLPSSLGAKAPQAAAAC